MRYGERPLAAWPEPGIPEIAKCRLGTGRKQLPPNYVKRRRGAGHRSDAEHRNEGFPSSAPRSGTNTVPRQSVGTRAFLRAHRRAAQTPFRRRASERGVSFMRAAERHKHRSDAERRNEGFPSCAPRSGTNAIPTQSVGTRAFLRAPRSGTPFRRRASERGLSFEHAAERHKRHSDAERRNEGFPSSTPRRGTNAIPTHSVGTRGFLSKKHDGRPSYRMNGTKIPFERVDVASNERASVVGQRRGGPV